MSEQQEFFLIMSDKNGCFYDERVTPESIYVLQMTSLTRTSFLHKFCKVDLSLNKLLMN